MLSFTVDSVTVEDVDDYAQSRGKSAWLSAPSSPADEKEAAIRRSTDYIATAYNARWNVEFDADDVPDEVRFAIAEGAIRELAEPGSLSPDLERGGAVKRLKAGSVEVEYADGAAATTTFTTIDGLLNGLLLPAKGKTATSFIARA